MYGNNAYAYTLAHCDYSPSELLQYILKNKSIQQSLCLFLDIDGTLSEFNRDPAQSFIPSDTLNTLQKILDINIPVIAITGRSVAVASALLRPLNLPIAGIHGLEIRLNPQQEIRIAPNHIDFSVVQQDLYAACLPYPELRIENKTHAVALHYRQCPQLASMAKHISQQIQSLHPALKINVGKYVYELLPQGADKGQAIQTFLQHLKLAHVLPIFIGDDQTDESGFITINRYHGISIKVGTEATAARYRLQDVRQVAEFLQLLAQHLTTSCKAQPQAPYGEKECLN